MRSLVRLLSLWVLLALLSACAGISQQQPSSAGWKTHSEQLAALQRWTANGKLALRTAEASESASIVWEQHHLNTHLQLSGPLGIGATTIDSDGQRLDIRQGDDFHSIDISTPDAIVMNTGLDLPLNALTHWLKGLPAPNSKLQSFELNPQTELLQSLQQDDWDVQFQRYGEFQGYILPTRMQIERGTTRAKIVISSWQTSLD
jgi:outer membrane lipoprotein LolB